MNLKAIFNQSKKENFFIVALIGLAALSFVYISGQDDSSIVTAPVKAGPFEVNVAVVGELNSSNNNQFLIPVNDLQRLNIFDITVTRLNSEGTILDSGDFVIEFDKSPLYTKLLDIEKDILKAKEEYEGAKLDTTLSLNEEREKKIDLQNAVDEAEYLVEQVQYESRSAIRTANNNLEKAKRELQRKLNKYKQSQMQNKLLVNKKLSELQNVIEIKNEIISLMNKMTVHSTIKGMVVYEKDQDGSRKRPGSKVQIFSNPVVATIPDLKNLISKAFVNEIDVSKIKVGQNVKVIADAFMNKTYKGKVISVANMGIPLAGKDANMFEISIAVENIDLMLKPSMRTNNFILAADYDNALTVPIDAIHVNDSINFVFKKSGTSIVKQQVNTGDANENEIVILNGLKEHDEVLLSYPEHEDDFELIRLK
jgi:HlyD family secretion protein